ncbi:MAG: hypothetical protein E4H38_06995 [Gemmatimonadales bacterium]|nr:MAG: hypothetical protein E4H38_06995 [Gemmatimonadales bacterium]
MLNYLWAGLIALSFVFALVIDVGDLRRDTYRNGSPLPVTLEFRDGYDPAAHHLPVTVRADSAAWSAHFGRPVGGGSYAGEVVQTADGRELRFAKDVSLPEPLATARRMMDLGNINVAYDESELRQRLEHLDDLRRPNSIGDSASDELVRGLRDFIFEGRA